jgi:DNA polymerase-3 subunit alpha
MKRAIRELKPDHFRRRGGPFGSLPPGPMENIPVYSRRKKGSARKSPISPRRLEPILKSTYGVIVYQEQIMQIVRAMAGFSYGQADFSGGRSPISKPTNSPPSKDQFIAGCLKNGKDR